MWMYFWIAGGWIECNNKDCGRGLETMSCRLPLAAGFRIRDAQRLRLSANQKDIIMYESITRHKVIFQPGLQ